MKTFYWCNDDGGDGARILAADETEAAQQYVDGGDDWGSATVEVWVYAYGAYGEVDWDSGLRVETSV